MEAANLQGGTTRRPRGPCHLKATPGTTRRLRGRMPHMARVRRLRLVCILHTPNSTQRGAGLSRWTYRLAGSRNHPRRQSLDSLAPSTTRWGGSAGEDRGFIARIHSPRKVPTTRVQTPVDPSDRGPSPAQVLTRALGHGSTSPRRD